MFDVAGNIGTSAAPGDFFGWPNDNQFDFETSLTPGVGGTFYVRGNATDASDVTNTDFPSPLSYPIVARDITDGNLSGIAPPSGKNWQTTTLNTNGILSNRVLIYGEAATDGYDWKLIPRSTSFTPSATVALCAGLNGGEDFNDTTVVRQESVGALGFIDGGTICASNASLSMIDGSTGALALLHRVGRVARAMFEPEPLSASVALSTIGGSASGAKKDVFSFLVLPKVTLTYLSTGATAPILGTLAANVKVNQLFSAVVNVKTPAGEPAGGVTVTLSAVTNNGTGTGIFQVRPGYTGTLVCNPANSTYGPFLSQPSVTTLGTVGLNGESQATNAVWSGNLCFSKTGGLSIVATSAGGSSGAAARSTKASAKINVKP
ncbi:MAG TPA: hypothetical protein VMY76_08570 [Gemmatimonadales bacterium]|nr:hypothetical protein [Gemmatimonadales bacterium]